MLCNWFYLQVFYDNEFCLISLVFILKLKVLLAESFCWQKIRCQLKICNSTVITWSVKSGSYVQMFWLNGNKSKPTLLSIWKLKNHFCYKCLCLSSGKYVYIHECTLVCGEIWALFYSTGLTILYMNTSAALLIDRTLLIYLLMWTCEIQILS